MKKGWLKKAGVVATTVLAMLAFAGCGSDNAAPTAGKEKLKVVTTIYPVYDLAQRVGGDKVDVSLLVKPGAEPHDWEPTSSDLKEIGTAKVFLYSGSGMEPVDKVLTKEVLQNAKPYELSKGLELIKRTEEDEDHEHGHDHDKDHHDHDKEHHDHDKDHKHDKDHDHDKKHEEHEHHHHGEFDPHVWLDPMNVAQEADVVAKAFAEADPANKDYYEANAKAYKEELKKLDDRFMKEVATLPNKTLVTSHEAFAYLAHRYGLTQMGIMGIDADDEPTPEKMAEIINFIREHDVKAIYTEELVSPKLSETIAKETGIQILVLNPIEGLTPEQQKKGYNYVKLMEENLEALKAGLK